MKITIVTETFPPEINGVAMTLGRIVEGLRRRRHEVTVAVPARRDRTPGTHPASDLVSLPGMRIPRYPELRLGFPAKGPLIRRWRDDRPDIVHVATEGPLGWSATRAAHALGIPLVTSYHTNFHRYGAYYGYGALQSGVLRWLRHIHGRSRCTFVPSEDLRTGLEQERFANLRVLGRGVDTACFSPDKRDFALRREWGVDDDTPVALYVGRVAGEKNLPLTIRAWEAMRETAPTMPLVIVGDGPERPRLERTRPEIRFAGMRRGEELARHYASADVFPFASTTETFGNVVTEAMASGLLVVAFDYAAPAKFIRDGLNGFLAPFDDDEAYLAAAHRAAAVRPVWPALRAAARDAVLPYSWDSILDNYESTLTEVLTPAEAS